MDIDAEINPLLRELGRLVFNFNTLEHSVRRLAWNLIDPQDQRVGQIVTDTLGAARLEDLARALLAHREVDPLIQERANVLLQNFAAVRSRRNDFVHAIWRVPNDAKDLTNMDAARTPTRKRPEFTPVAGSTSKEAIAVVASEACQVDEQLELLILEILVTLRSGQ